MTIYTIIIAPRAKRDIDNLPLSIKSRIGGILYNVLAKNPHIGKALKAGLKGLYSYRVGDYRIIYEIAKHQLIIQVIKIMHRREAYR